ncbi:MAG TPA: tetratricopeptide repeat protein [Bryobacteraceae bacterium]|nr:tetratricopeptide repeat protein [Bryobacteraceae bacterium]
MSAPHADPTQYSELRTHQITTHEPWTSDIDLPSEPAQVPISGTVSVERLQHPIPDKALSEFERATRSAQKKKIQEAIKHLEKAVKIAPNYTEAHNNLGVWYMITGKLQKAATELEAALKLDTSSVFVNTNLSLIRFLSKQYAEAEALARAALRKDEKFTRANYILGLSLVAEGKNQDEAVDHLDRAAREFPAARLEAAHLLVRKGSTGSAAAELRAYLSVPDVKQRGVVEGWLARLER